MCRSPCGWRCLRSCAPLRLKDDQVFDIISHGQKNMPSYAVQVPPQDRRAVISYIRSLQGGSQP